jgi:hypothetical protein
MNEWSPQSLHLQRTKEKEESMLSQVFWFGLPLHQVSFITALRAMLVFHLYFYNKFLYNAYMVHENKAILNDYDF